MKITSGSTIIFSGTPAAMQAAGLFGLHDTVGTLSADDSVPFRFVVTLPTSVGNRYQGISIKQNLTWSVAS